LLGSYGTEPSFDVSVESPTNEVVVSDCDWWREALRMQLERSPVNGKNGRKAREEFAHLDREVIGEPLKVGVLGWPRRE
jgi:hypothetical protein